MNVTFVEVMVTPVVGQNVGLEKAVRVGVGGSAQFNFGTADSAFVVGSVQGGLQRQLGVGVGVGLRLVQDALRRG